MQEETIDWPLLTIAEAWKNAENLPLDKTTRAVRLLDARYSQLRDSLQEQLLTVWNSLVSIDEEQKVFTITQAVEGKYGFSSCVAGH